MRICFSFDHLFPAEDRAGRHIETLVRRFRDWGHEVSVVTTPVDQPQDEEGVEILRLRETPGARGQARRDTLLGKAITKFLRETEAQVLFAEGLTPLSAVATKAAKRAGAAVILRVLSDAAGIVHSIGGERKLSPSALRKRIVALLGDADVAAASSEECATHLEEFEAGPIRVLDKCVDLSVLDPDRVGKEDEEAFRSEHELGDRPLLLYAREDLRAETVAAALEVLRPVVDKHPEVVFLVAGDLDDVEAAEASIESAGLGDNVKLLGRLPLRDLCTAYATASVFVAPPDSRASESELLEAMAMGCPLAVCGERSGAVGDVVREGGAAVLTDESATEAGEDLLALLDDAARLEAMRKKARTLARTKDIGQAVDQVLEICESVLGIEDERPEPAEGVEAATDDGDEDEDAAEIDADEGDESEIDSEEDDEERAPRRRSRRARGRDRARARADEDSDDGEDADDDHGGASKAAERTAPEDLDDSDDEDDEREDREEREEREERDSGEREDADDDEDSEGRSRRRRTRRRRRRGRRRDEDGDEDERDEGEDGDSEDGERAAPRREERESVEDASRRLRELDPKLTLRELMPFLRPPKDVFVFSMTASSGQHRAGDAIHEAFKAVDQNLRARQMAIADFLARGLERDEVERRLDELEADETVFGSPFETGQGAAAEGALESDQVEAFLDGAFDARLESLILEKRPHHVILTHYLPLRFLTRLKAEKGLRMGITAVIPDHDIHRFWIADGVDQYQVANEKVKFKMLRAGVPETAVEVVGVPVHPRFEEEIDRDRVRRDLGLKSGQPTILLRPGGMGDTETTMAAIRRILEVGHPFNLIVLAGRNDGLVEAVRRLDTPKNVFAKAFGFVESIREVMGASDLMITRATGHTVAEAFAAGVPLILLRPATAVEERAADWFVERGVALKARDSVDLEWYISDLLRNQAHGLRKMRDRAHGDGRPKSGAASKCVERISRLLN